MADLIFVAVHIDGAEVWLNARRILSIWPGGGNLNNGERSGSTVVMNFGPPIRIQEDPDEIVELLRRAAVPDA